VSGNGDPWVHAGPPGSSFDSHVDNTGNNVVEIANLIDGFSPLEVQQQNASAAAIEGRSGTDGSTSGKAITGDFDAVAFGAGNPTLLLPLRLFVQSRGSGTTAESDGLLIRTPFVSGGVITAAYGLKIEDQTVAGASTNRAIDVNGKFYMAGDGQQVVMVPTTSDPHIVGALWNNAGTLTISAG